VIETISGQTLADFLRERLLEPLGMVDTAFAVPEGKRDRLAAVYGRLDFVAPGQTLKSSLAQWLGGFNERIDVTQTYPSIWPQRSSVVGTACSARRATTSASRRCWRTAGGPRKWTSLPRLLMPAQSN
jgi:CubicO group peptidase (beta-lactamase class C family)